MGLSGSGDPDVMVSFFVFCVLMRVESPLLALRDWGPLAPFFGAIGTTVLNESPVFADGMEKIHERRLSIKDNSSFFAVVPPVMVQSPGLRPES